MKFGLLLEVNLAMSVKSKYFDIEMNPPSTNIHLNGARTSLTVFRKCICHYDIFSCVYQGPPRGGSLPIGPLLLLFPFVCF